MQNLKEENKSALQTTGICSTHCVPQHESQDQINSLKHLAAQEGGRSCAGPWTPAKDMTDGTEIKDNQSEMGNAPQKL
jgi:hypothetical protein